MLIINGTISNSFLISVAILGSDCPFTWPGDSRFLGVDIGCISSCEQVTFSLCGICLIVVRNRKFDALKSVNYYPTATR